MYAHPLGERSIEQRTRHMFEIAAIYAMGTLFAAGAWAFDSWMMKGEEQ